MRGTGRNGASASHTATGPAPGPPPPCGVEKVLCTLMCRQSMPMSPGRATPTSAFRLAPSPYTKPPASCTSRQISAMSDSNMPVVFGLVSISAAVSSSRCAFSTSRSMRPLGADFSSTVCMPASTALAGLVPCAESGTSTLRRFASPREACQARIIIMPVSSPWAPAAGCKVTCGRPAISPSHCCRSKSRPSSPCAVSSGCSGCKSASPGRRATCSLTRGLYFMVQEPSG